MSDESSIPNPARAAQPGAHDQMARQGGYNAEGANYDSIYSSRLGRGYHRRRSELLARSIREHFNGQRLDVLELGCGPGLTLHYLCEHTPHRLVGADFSSTMLERARARTAPLANRPTLMLANAMELPFADQSFDVVYATRFIHQFQHEDKLRIAREIKRVLRPGGLVQLEFYARPFNLLNYYVHLGDADIYSTLDLHLVHYPSKGQVREIAGEAFRVEGLRFLGDRAINRALGYRVFSALNACVSAVPGLRWLMNEHWVVYSPLREAASVAAVPSDARAPTDSSIRCPKCRGPVTQTGAALNCTTCGLAYAVTCGFPNLLAHEALPLVPRGGSTHAS